MNWRTVSRSTFCSDVSEKSMQTPPQKFNLRCYHTRGGTHEVGRIQSSNEQDKQLSLLRRLLENQKIIGAGAFVGGLEGGQLLDELKAVVREVAAHEFLGNVMR